MTRMTGGAAIVKSLRAYDIDHVFCIPGVQLDHLFNALYDEGNAIRTLQTRHEQGAAYMAFGYAASTGRVGAYAVVPGPGFLNAAAALSTAYACNAPVLCLTGQVPTELIGRNTGAHHEINDQLGVMAGLTKYAARIEHPADAPEVIEQAFAALRSGRVRPAAIEAAPDVLSATGEVALRDAIAPPAPPTPDPELIDQAAELLGHARRPMIVAGSGAFDSAEALLAVAETLQAPISLSRNAKGAVPADHPLAVSESAGHRLWADCDAVLAIGTRLYEQYRGWGVDRELALVRIDIDPTEIARQGTPSVGIRADANAALTALHDALQSRNISRDSRAGELDTLRGEMEAEYAKLSPQIDFIRVLREELPRDGFVVSESTQMAYMARIAMPFYHPRSFVTPGYQGTLGFGFPTSLGVKVANPDCQVVSISGDGGFMFGSNELATAVQHGIATVALVFNDGAYGNVKRTQLHKYGGRVIATELRNPDFVKLAEAYGAQGIRAKTADELRAGLRKGFAHDGPTVIEIPVGELPSPWHLMHLPRVRG